MFKVLHQRLRERFFLPVRQLRRRDSETQPTMRPGFAILALDCLLIETLVSFRAGTPLRTGQSGRAFVDFLKGSRHFKKYFGNDDMASEFYRDVRNGLLHDGETRKDWKIRENTKFLLDCDAGSRVINRTLFHGGVLCEYRQYFKDLRRAEERANLRLRLAALSQSGDPGGGD
jgi:hypothetical protein